MCVPLFPISIWTFPSFRFGLLFPFYVWNFHSLFFKGHKIFIEITTLDLSYVVTVKSMVEILQNFVAFSEYMIFKKPQEHEF